MSEIAFEDLDEVEWGEVVYAEDSCECEACTDPDYCGECECSPCECCGDCGNYSCSCGEDTRNFREEAPWVERGQTQFDYLSVRGRPWTEVWPEIDSKVDPVMAAADFYLLEALSANVVFPQLKVRTLDVPNEAVDREFFEILGLSKNERRIFVQKRNASIAERLMNDPIYEMASLSKQAEAQLYELVETLDPTFVNYAHMACAGEARHHHALGGNWFTGGREVAWVEWRPMFEALGNQGLMDLHDLFLEFGEVTAFGGIKWATACKVLYDRLEGKLGPTDHINKRLFIDRVFTLEHNGGCFLNKIRWSVKNRRKLSVSYMRQVLDAHANSDFKLLFGTASIEVRALFKQYVSAASKLLNPQSRPEWMELVLGTVKPRIICQCGSNPALGHNSGCYVVLRPSEYGFDGIVDINVPKRWYTIVEADQFDSFSWHRWHATDFTYPIGPQGFEVRRADKVKIEFYYGIHSTGRGYYSGHKVYDATVGDLLDGKFKISFKQFNKKGGAIGAVLDCHYSYNLSIPELGLWDEVSSDYCYDYERRYKEGLTIGVPEAFARHIK